MGELAPAIQFIRATKAALPAADKARIQQAFVDRFKPRRTRSLFVGAGYSMRFSHTTGAAFSNTVLALSAVRDVDDKPLVVCVVGPSGVRFLLANSTFIRRVSHSSLHLRLDNVKGSFNGSDILTSHQGLANEPKHFGQLFDVHRAVTWTENLERLVQATTTIEPKSSRFDPSPVQTRTILTAPERAAAFLLSDRFGEIDEELRGAVRKRESEIAHVASLDNGNLRGTAVEQLITGHRTTHDLGDLQRTIVDGVLDVDVKTKLLGKSSAPKAYNIDKMLEQAAQEGSVFAFLIIGVDPTTLRAHCRLVPVLDDALRAESRIQHHWAGRGSRGVTQFSGSFDRVLARNYAPRIDIARAKAFMTDLIAL